MSVQKITLTRVYRSDKSKEGVAFVSKLGKPYTKLGLQTKEHGEKWLSGFDGSHTSSWKEGDVVDVVVTPNVGKDGKTYLNFEVPKDTDKLESRLAALEVQVMNLTNTVSRSPAMRSEPTVQELNNVLPPESEPDF